LRVDRKKPSRRAERGAVIVEFGLIAPILLLLVMGIVDFGYMIHKSTLVNNVARDGARAASLGGTYADVSGVITGELAEVGIGSDYTYSITCTNPSGSNCTNNAGSFDANAISGSTVVVTIDYTYHWITPVGAICQYFGSTCVGNTMDLTRTAEMIRE